MNKIIILGGGFAGIRAALDLEKKLKNKAEIILIDKKNYHLFTPALYEVASAYKFKNDPFSINLKKTICIPYSDIFENKNINFIQSEVASIDFDKKEVKTKGDKFFNYDYLIITLGSQAADFNVPGVKEYAFRFKEIEDAIFLNQKTGELIKEVLNNLRPKPVKILVVGAGFSGIEVAAEFTCWIKKMTKDHGIKYKIERTILLEAGPKILPAISDKERKIILKRLTNLGIEVMEEAVVEEIGYNYVKLKNGKRLDSDIVIWTAGTCLPDLLFNVPKLSLSERNKIKIYNNLEVKDLPGVFAAGDNAEFIDPKTNKPIPALAYVAADQGKIIAKNILNLMKNKKPSLLYKPFYDVWVAPLGGKYALARLWGGINIKGFWGWVIRELIDFKYMLSILSVKKAFLIMWQEIKLFTKND
jgi:NADH dehydrogenase